MVKYGDKVLRRPSKNINIDEIDYIYDLKYDLEYSNKDDMGISVVNMSGNLYRVFSVRYMGDNYFFLNPSMVKVGDDKTISNEKNHSIKGEYVMMRENEVTLNYYDGDLSRVTNTFNGRLAQLINQQLDMLDGIMYIDYMNKEELKTKRVV